ncbi:MAG TPA: hypothetical protein VMW16_10905 [Sedimentisphaerales bacterium]|nr:hypothetical protein [Sedimentisphaerales bacterium]
MTISRNAVFYLFLVCSVSFAGCGKKAEERKVDENKPMSEVKAEAEKMSTAELRDMALKYKEAVVAKAAEVDEAMGKFKAVVSGEDFGAEAKDYTARMEKMDKSLSALQERFEVYCDKLKEKGGDLSGLEVQ